MFAVIKTGGKQYSVESGKTLKIEKILGKKGDSFSFDKVLIISDEKKQILGTPIIKGAIVKATIINQIRDKKIIVFKKRRRKNSKRQLGHRQYLTVLKIDKIINKSTETKKFTQKIDMENTGQKKKINAKTELKKTGTKTKKTVKKKTISKKNDKKKTIKKGN